MVKLSSFKLYDIRGKYPQEINEELAYKTGRAIVLLLKSKNIVVGRDCRLSSPSLSKALIQGIIDQGCNTIDIGLCSTPMLYFASFKENAVMITASHNPKEYNGLKICKKGARALTYKSGLNKIKKIVEKNKFPKAKKGRILKKSILKEYISFANKFRKKISSLKIIIDAGNGMAGFTAPHLFKTLPIKIIPMNFELNGNFPNHEPNPLNPENTKELQKTVLKEKADLGIAYDGDCDRVFFVDEKGQRLSAESSLLLLAQHFSSKNEKIVYSNNCSKIIPEILKQMKIKPIISSVGHSMVKQSMKKNKAVLGVEFSGHFYFKQNHHADNADIAVLLMLNILSSAKKPLSELIKKYKKYFMSEEISIKVNNQEKTMKNVEHAYKNKAKISQFYGLMVDFRDWRFVLRKSQTENVLKLVVEAKSTKLLNYGVNQAKNLIMSKGF